MQSHVNMTHEYGDSFPNYFFYSYEITVWLNEIPLLPSFHSSSVIFHQFAASELLPARSMLRPFRFIIHEIYQNIAKWINTTRNI